MICSAASSSAARFFASGEPILRGDAMLFTPLLTIRFERFPDSPRWPYCPKFLC